MAILRRDAPTALALSRQKVPLIDRNRCASAEGLRRGAYILAEAESVATKSEERQDGVAPTLIIIASGSEVSLALAAREKLQEEGLPTRVVSMPSWEFFDEQPETYRNEVLPPTNLSRLAIEAGVRQGWDKYVGVKGDAICLDRFGASSPGDVALKNLGFNLENVLKHARTLG